MRSTPETHKTRAVPRTWSPLTTLAGRRIMLLGSTGFLAKVMLSMLLERFGPERIYCVIRGTRSKSPRDRLFAEVLSSEMMSPLRERFGATFEAVVNKQVEPLGGDLSQPNMGLDETTLHQLRGKVDVIINSAGLVNFNPQLEQAIISNTLGALTVAELARELGAKLVHVSTCYVAGARSGRIREDTPVVGYFPLQAEMPGVQFDWRRELNDVHRIIEQVKARTDDAALEVSHRMEALRRLKVEGREPHKRTLRAAIANQRRRWVTEEQIRLGVERAKQWGWTNIYTYSKALGEQAVASTEGLDWSIIRPAIVESALHYPFPGWNEGMNTTAPLAYLGLNGQVTFPGNNKLVLDVVPVDAVASTTLAAAAAVLAGQTDKVYQVAAGDVNPCSMARAVTLVGVYRRRKTKSEMNEGEISRWHGELKLRQEPHPISRRAYENLSTPALLHWIEKARKAVDSLEPDRYGFLSRTVVRAQKRTKEVEEQLTKVRDVFDLFMPFIWENQYIFNTSNTRSLFESMNESDRALLPYEVERTDWRHYWLDVHLPGLEKWVFPKLDIDGPKRVTIPRDYKDLAELFDVRTRENGRRIAYHMVQKGEDATAYTFRDVRKASFYASNLLEKMGMKDGDRVLLISEGRPEWGMSYFGIVLGGGIAVPVDVDLSLSEVDNIAKAAGANLAISSPKHAARLATVNGESYLQQVRVIKFDELFGNAHQLDETEDLRPKKRRPEDPASVIFTSGTTGRPKGVVLSHQNFAALTARLSALFELNHHDAMLSVLPPHHTFEFSAGLLMPLAKGSAVAYLEERTPELVSKAFDELSVTAMIGVPAVIESLHRRIQGELDRLFPPARIIIRQLIRLNELLRDRTGLNLGQIVFRPVHTQFGGQLRYLISGAAPLRPDIYRELRGLGFGIHEGYGLTEASPVLTVGWPHRTTPAGSVGWPLPGIEVRILDPDDRGVGEVIARGPTIMKGYLSAPEATKEVLRNGWLHTGDQGRMDKDGHLFIVGREKDTIIDSSGKNVYPDEIEELYADTPLIEELSVVGIPTDSGTGERVACLVVPNYSVEIQGQKLSREKVHEELQRHFKDVSARLPFTRRIKVLHISEHQLARTSTRKVKRNSVRQELMRLEQARSTSQENFSPATKDSGIEAWVLKILATITRRSAKTITLGARLVDDLGFDSLMQLELFNTLEAEHPRARISADEIAEVTTVAEIVALAQRDKAPPTLSENIRTATEPEEPWSIPAPLVTIGKTVLGIANQLAYRTLFDIHVEGKGNIPANRNFLVASNHSSHLDMGLVKEALGVFGTRMRTVAAKDYFFDDPVRGIYFRNFSDLVPMDRHGSLRKSLRLASQAIHQGDTLLIFPEGTRSRDGKMRPFRPTIGWLCLHQNVDVLPIWLGGTHESLPVGANLPKTGTLEVRIGEPVCSYKMREATRSMSRSQAYRLVTKEVERRVRTLGGLPLDEDETEDVSKSNSSEQEERSTP
ncbi:MAG: AMP-binding protein [Myxococcales bacterium]|nr:AMP-binding protein [Myxococcales bacterium]